MVESRWLGPQILRTMRHQIHLELAQLHLNTAACRAKLHDVHVRILQLQPAHKARRFLVHGVVFHEDAAAVSTFSEILHLVPELLAAV